MSSPVRVPDDMKKPLQTLASVIGTSPGDLLHRAFLEYVKKHETEFVEAFQNAQKYIQSADVPGLADLLGASRRTRAGQASAAIRSKRT